MTEMRRRASGTPVYFDRNKLLNNRDEDKDMDYNDEYHDSGSKIAYDGALIDLADGQNRYQRDKARQRNYARAEENLDDQQMTWSDVENTLNTHV